MWKTVFEIMHFKYEPFCQKKIEKFKFCARFGPNMGINAYRMWKVMVNEAAAKLIDFHLSTKRSR